jgi:hypothetical protein
MRFSCRVWAMRGPMPFTNCRDVSRVSSTPEMLSADSGCYGAMPWPQARTWDDNDLFPVLSTGAPQRPAVWHKEARMGLCPGFPVELLGAAEPNAAFLNESRTRRCRWCPVTGNPDRPSLSSHVRHCGRGCLSPRLSSATGRNGPTAACE